jgi:hypothetical protein
MYHHLVVVVVVGVVVVVVVVVVITIHLYSIVSKSCQTTFARFLGVRVQRLRVRVGVQG